MSCCEPSAPDGASSAVIGRLQFAGVGFLGQSRPFTFKSGECCLPSTPTDARWVAAAPGMEPLLKQADEHAMMTDCCFGISATDPFASKQNLEVNWLPAVNAHLAEHGLVAQLHTYWQYNGQSSTPEMEMLIYALDDEAAKEEMQRLTTISTEAAKKAPKRQHMS